MSIVTKELERVSIVPKGVWNSQNIYERLDIVNHNGSSYIARQNVPVNISLSNTNYWKLIAEKGADGTNGTNGTNGNDGNGISSITELNVNHQPGQVDTYQINFTNGNNFNFSVYNGANGTNGTNGAKGQTGETGNGISSITELNVTHQPGQVDTYQINFTNGNNFNFGIYNGADGVDGAGTVSTVDGIDASNQNVNLLILGNNAPTENTVGQLKQRYYDRTNKILYICTNINTTGAQTIYTWQNISVPYNFKLTLYSASWVENSLTISNNLFTTTSTYSFIISPEGSSFKEYVDCGIYADDITTNGEITFYCDEVPVNDLVVNVIRMVTQTG